MKPKILLPLFLIIFSFSLPAYAQKQGKERKITETISFIGKVKKKLPTEEGTLIMYNPDGTQAATISGNFSNSYGDFIRVTKGNLLYPDENTKTYGDFEIKISSPNIISAKKENKTKMYYLDLTPLFTLEDVSITYDRDFDIYINGQNQSATYVIVKCNRIKPLVPNIEINKSCFISGYSRDCRIRELKLDNLDHKKLEFDFQQKQNALKAIEFPEGKVTYQTDANNGNELIAYFRKESDDKELQGIFKSYVPNGWNGTQRAAKFEGSIKYNGNVATKGDFLLPMPAENDIYTFYTDVLSSVYPLFTTITENNLKTYNIVCEEPGTILNQIPPQQLALVDSLTITGILDERDVKIIDQMKNLSYLDLSETYITYDPEHKKSIQADQYALALIGQLLNQAIDDQYKDGNMSTLNYKVNKSLTELMAASGSIDPKTDICFMPKVSDMPLLHTVKLPKLATEIQANAFVNCKSLKNIEWPDALTYIGPGCFAFCSSLKELVFPPKLYNISLKEVAKGYTAFEECDAVETIDMSQCTDFIKEYGFKFGGMPNLKEMRFPRNMKEITFKILGDQIIDFYIPNTLKKLVITRAEPTRTKKIYKGAVPTGKGILHFASPIPPADGGCRADKMYIPKGSLTPYYSKYGSEVEYIEE